MNSKHKSNRRLLFRPLHLEPLDFRLTLDADDALSEAILFTPASTTPQTLSNNISDPADVDMYRIAVQPGQTVDFDIDTSANGPGGLGSFIRLFNSAGQQIATNNNGRAPGENTVGFDAYLRFTFPTNDFYYIGVSNNTNVNYNSVTGDGDVTGGTDTTGAYTLTAVALPVDLDDTLAEANPFGAISVTPITITDRIVTDVDVDIYKYSVNTGQVVDFDIDTTLNGTGGLGSFIRIFNDLGNELAFNDNGVAPGESVLGFDSYLRYTFPSAGVFYIGISNANNTLYNTATGGNDQAGGANSIGDYSLTISTPPVIPADADDTIPEAFSLGAVNTTGTTRNADINPDSDVDLVSFTVTAGQTVDFDIDTTANGSGGLGSFIRLFNSAGTELSFNNNAAAPGENTVGFDAYLRHTFATAGTYYLGVSNANNTLYNVNTGDGDNIGGANATGAYSLTVQALPVDTNDAISEATALGTITSAQSVASDQINPDIDVDLYSFDVAAGQIVDFDVDTTLNGPGGLGSFLRIFNSAGSEIAFNDNGVAPGESTVGFDAYLRFTFNTAGTYYVGVSNANNTLYSANAGTGDNAGGANSIGTYTLRVNTAPTAPVDPDDTLVNATTLGPISTTPVFRNASITPDVDVDMYSFTVTGGQTVDFDIDTTQNGAGGLGSFIRLFDSSGVEIAFNNNGNAPGENIVGFDAYLRRTFTAGGTFYLGVSNANNTTYNALNGTGDQFGGANATGDYTLTVQALPDDDDDQISEAPILGAVNTVPAQRSGTITPDIDVDLYHFTANANQVVDFDLDTTLNGGAGLNSFLRLFNSTGQEIAFNNNAAAPGEATVGFDAYFRFTFTTSGNYYIGVSNATNTLYNASTGAGDTSGGFNSIGAYDLRVQDVGSAVDDTNDTLIEAPVLGTPSTTPNTISSSISPDTDVNLYQFTAASGQVIDFDIDTAQNGPGGLGSYLRFFNSSGTQIAFNDNAAAPGEGTAGFDAYLRFTAPAAGTYYVGVSNATNVNYNPVTGSGDVAGGANSTGSYQLIITSQTGASPALALSSVASSISEAGGVTTGTITRSGADISSSLIVSLASSDTGEATVPNTVTIPANQTSATFTITGIDDIVVDGTQSVTLTATASGFTSTTLGIQVTDNDSATSALGLSSVASSISEGGGTTTGTVTRTSPNISSPLVVTLSSSDTGEASVPSSVTIPANQTSATFIITGVNDTIIDGNQNVTITAAASGFPNATLNIQVRDNDSIWTNPDNPLDVNDDNKITAFDALPIVSYLNLFPAGTLPTGSPPPYLDVNSDNQVTAFDALEIITYLNLHPIGAPEFVPAEEGRALTETHGRSFQDAALVDAYFTELGRRNRDNNSVATTN